MFSTVTVQRSKYLSTTLKSKLLHQMKACSKIVVEPLENLYEASYQNTLKLAKNISDPSHVVNSEYRLLPSNQRYRVHQFSQIKLKNSVGHQWILKLHMELLSRSDVCMPNVCIIFCSNVICHVASWAAVMLRQILDFLLTIKYCIVLYKCLWML